MGHRIDAARVRAMGRWAAATALASACGSAIAQPPATSPSTPVTTATAPAGDTTRAPVRATDPGITDIIVTAQKRAQNLQDVPASIQAFDSRRLEAVAIKSVEDLPLLTPGLSIPRSGGGPTPYIRGVGAAQAGGGQETAVATFVDGIYYVDSFSVDLDTANIDRIEVLKGPQGTLSGRNATGGVINVITKDPVPEFGGTVSAYGGNYARYGADGYVTGGLAPNLSANLAVAVQRQDDGFGRNLFPTPLAGYGGHDINYRQLFSTRGKIKWDDGATRITLAGDYSYHSDDEGNAATLYPGSLGLDGQLIYGGCLAGGGSQANCITAAQAGASRKAGGFYNVDTNITGFTKVRSFGGFARIEHDFGSLRLMSLTGYRHDNIAQPLDNDFTPVNIVTAAPFHYINRSFSEEVQLSSDKGGRLNWIVGGYYLHAKGGSAIHLTGFGLAAPVPGVAPYGLASEDLQGVIYTHSYAVFGDATYKLFDPLELTIGGRFTRDKRAVDGSTTLTPFADATDTGAGTPVSVPAAQSKSFQKFTFRAVATYHLNRDVSTYASFNRGFKSGNFNALDASQPAVKPEVIDAYEVGLKSQLFDRRVTFNAAGYYYDYSNLQLLVAQGDGATRIENAAKARIKGIEADTTVRATDHLTFYGGMSRIWAKYLSYPDAATYEPTGFGGNTLFITDLSGHQLAKAPKWTGNLGATLDIPTSMGTVTPSGNWSYNGGFPWDSDGRLRQKAYSIVNLSVNWLINDSRLALRLDVKNLTQAQYCVFCTATGTGDIFAAGRPRTITGTISYKF